MAETFLLNLVTPERSLYSGQVKQLVAPGDLGEFGVLPGHANMLAGLTMGTMSFTNESGEKQLVAAGGFAEVSREHVTVLLDDAFYVDELDPGALDQEIAALESEAPGQDDQGFSAWQQKVAWKRYCRSLAVA